MQCLWLTLADPEPATNGQLIYSKGLIEAACRAGASLTVIGLARPENPRASVDPRVKAVVEFFGGFPKEMRLFMRRMCPVLILHGEADPTVPVQEAYDLQNLLEKKGMPYEIKVYPGVGHGFDSVTGRDAGIRSLRFLQKHLAGAT